MRRGAPLLGALAAWWLAGAAVLASQVSGTLDVGASDIRYDLFRSSTALSLTPTIAFDRGWTSLAARGTLLRYESGHRDLHGSVQASTFSPAFGPLRVEIALDAGASRYLSMPAFSHVFGAADLHYLAGNRGLWIGGSNGPTSFGGTDGHAGSFEVGTWVTAPVATLTLTATYRAIGDTSYTDFVGATRVARGRWELDGRLGARVWSTGAGHGVYGEASLTYALGRHLGVQLGGGRYPTDPTRGIIAGRYATVGLRLATGGPRRTDPYREALQWYHTSASPDPSPGAPVLELGPSDPGGRVIRIRVDGARRVELMGDFSDWDARDLAQRAPGVWELVAPIGPGPHLVEVRVDGGPWGAPAGVTAVKDEFGGEAGLIVVPL